MKNVGIFALVVVLFYSSCTNKNKESILLNLNCDSTNVTFTNQIKPIMISNCATSSCHAGSQPQANINLETYDNIKTYANASYNAMNNGTMPKGYSKLPDCYIAQMKKWINDGTPNN